MGIKLVGNTLGERQRQLNLQVLDAITNKVDFAQVGDATEEIDVDKLFKIDVASKFRNVDYIMEVLKFGDTLCISRALKCNWLFSEEFSNVMNPDYLHQNVFPFMSIKMKKKLLSTLYTHVRNETRAEYFYTYCMNTKLTNIAKKFLLSTSEQFKLGLATKSWNYYDLIGNRDRDYTKHFIKESFLLAEAYLDTFEHHRRKLLHQLRYLYSVSDTKYLNLLEIYKEPNERRDYYSSAERFGLQLTKDIITKHKHRVIQNPRLYIRLLNKKILVKNSTAEDAKTYIPAILPDDFWSINFCDKYKYIIDLLPRDKKFEFMKKTFNKRYPNNPFETTYDFYRYKCFTLMTSDEQECWALHHIASQLEMLGAGEEYKFYKYVNFEKAFADIKKLVIVTNDKEKRLKMVSILIESAKNQREVEMLLNYFYERHVNEVEYAKKKFLNAVIQYHNPFEFDESCWTALNKLFYNMEVYSVTSKNIMSEYIIIALIYHIIKNKEIPTAITNYLEGDDFNNHKLGWGIDKLVKEEEKEIVYQFLMQLYINMLNKMNRINESNTKKLRKYIHSVLYILSYYKKTKADCPEMVLEFCESDWQEFKYHPLLRDTDSKPKAFSQHTFIRCLKSNASHVINLLQTLKQNVKERQCNRVDLFLKKLKVYFPHELTEHCLIVYKEILNEKDLNSTAAQAAARAVFQLANESFKIEFMDKHAPLESKIDHTKTDQTLLHIQQAICAHAIVSRPPIPLKNIMVYIKGDYVKHCVPVFDWYLANLTVPLFKEFVASLLKQPVSVQKHGLRLAFLCYDKDSLVKVLTSVWGKTKNVSLKMIIYKDLFHKILAEEPQNQSHLYQVLKTFTLDIHEDDDDKLFNLLTSNKLPKLFLGDYTQASLEVINKLPQKIKNLQRLQNILTCVALNMELIGKESIEPIVYEHIKDRFAKREEQGDGQEKSLEKLNAINAVLEAKWRLIVKYVTYIPNNKDLEASLKITNLILKLSAENWNNVRKNRYKERKLFTKFIEDLSAVDYCDGEFNKNIKTLFQHILEVLQKTFSIDNIYLLLWDLRLNIIARDVIINGSSKYDEGSDEGSDEGTDEDQARSQPTILGRVIFDGPVDLVPRHPSRYPILPWTNIDVGRGHDSYDRRPSWAAIDKDSDEDNDEGSDEGSELTIFKEDKLTIFKEIGTNYANEVGNLIKEYIGKDMYYVSFLTNIEEKILDKGKLITHTNVSNSIHILQDFYVIMCLELLQFKIAETNMLALSMVPMDYKGNYLKDYKNILKEFKNIDDKEFRCKLYQKFVNNDLQYRQFMQSI